MTTTSSLVKEDIQKPTNQQSFQPTANQQTWLDVAIQIRSDSPSDIEAACIELGNKIIRQQWYDWKKIPGFIQWFYTEWRERRKEWLGELDAIGMKFAKKGSVEHWKTMRQAIGEEETDKPGVQNNIQINLDKYVKETS